MCGVFFLDLYSSFLLKLKMNVQCTCLPFSHKTTLWDRIGSERLVSIINVLCTWYFLGLEFSVRIWKRPVTCTVIPRVSNQYSVNQPELPLNTMSAVGAFFFLSCWVEHLWHGEKRFYSALIKQQGLRMEKLIKLLKLEP